MGCWSVNCGISNIAITSGNECCILPIKKNSESDTREYCPATLPIFGQYDDYGGIENIIEDDNTKVIAEYFGITIEEFVSFLVDGKFTYKRDEIKPIVEKLKKNGKYVEISDWRFMWIDKNVYDFMKIDIDNYSKGYMDYGTGDMLKLFGFEFVEKSDIFPNYDPKRFCKKWKKGDVEIYSDGRTILSIDGNYVYHLGKGGVNSLETYIDIPDDMQYLKTKNREEAWKLMDKFKQCNTLSYIFGRRYGSYDFNYGEKKNEEMINKYFDNLEIFGDKIVELINISHNLHPMSGEFKPHVLYLTPQCGEYKLHQIILDKFSEINRNYIIENE